MRMYHISISSALRITNHIYTEYLALWDMYLYANGGALVNDIVIVVYALAKWHFFPLYIFWFMLQCFYTIRYWVGSDVVGQ